MILDAILLIVIIVVLQIIKSKNSNFLFFPKGAVLALPPEQTDTDRKQKKNNQILQISIEHDTVKQHPFNRQFYRIIMSTSGLIILVFIKFVISFFFIDQSMLTFYMISLILIYTVKLGIQTFFLTNYSRKITFLIAMGFNLIFYLSFIFLKDIQGIYDHTIKSTTQDQVKHFKIIFNRDFNFFTPNLVLISVLLFNFFVIISIIPSIIKFGNWYSQTLKLKYDEEKGDDKSQQKIAKTIYKLNVYLVGFLIMIFFSHRFCYQLCGSQISFVARTISLLLTSYIICSTMPDAIEFNASFAYKYIMQYFETDSKQKRIQLRKKIASYIYYIWYHYFQYMFRLLLPILIYLILVNQKYIHNNPTLISSQNHIDRALNPKLQCISIQNQIQLMRNMFRCSLSPSENQLSINININGGILGIKQNLDQQQIYQNIQNFGMFTKQFKQQFIQLIFWYSSISIYILTVTYIVFLRKTVHDT